MKCLTPSERAIAAERDDDDPHLADCLACRGAVLEQRAIRALVRRAPAPPLPRARREAIAAEVLSRSYAMSGRRTWLARGAVLGAVLAAAAAALVLALWPTPAATVARAELAMTEDTSALVVRGVITEVAPDRPAKLPALVHPGGTADFTRLTVEDREVLELRNGTLTVDARNAREVEITMRGTTVHVEDAKICVGASGGVIETVTVFAGSAEVTSRGKLVVVEAGMVWVPDAVGPTTALREFRVGWAALRDGNLRAAVDAFDRARDPVVAEDAAYWAGVAAERLGDLGAAARRFAGFLDLFPASPHADMARVALARVRLAR
jgi:hypothetical protein